MPQPYKKTANDRVGEHETMFPLQKHSVWWLTAVTPLVLCYPLRMARLSPKTQHFERNKTPAEQQTGKPSELHCCFNPRGKLATVSVWIENARWLQIGLAPTSLLYHPDTATSFTHDSLARFGTFPKVPLPHAGSEKKEYIFILNESRPTSVPVEVTAFFSFDNMNTRQTSLGLFSNMLRRLSARQHFPTRYTYKNYPYA